jgi:hypothetical protein
VLCVAYFSLFFDDHISQLHEGATCGALAPDWYQELKGKTDVAWKAVEDFANALQEAQPLVEDGSRRHALSDSLTGFKGYSSSPPNSLKDLVTSQSSSRLKDIWVGKPETSWRSTTALRMLRRSKMLQ